MKKGFIICCIIGALLQGRANAQGSIGVGTDTPNPSSILDIEASDRGILIPRMTLAERNTNLGGIGIAETGLLIYNTTDDLFNYWDGTQWIPFPGVGQTDDDWFEDGTPPSSPDDINDDIFTYGKVGINIINPVRTLDIFGDMRIDGGVGHNIYGGATGSIFMHSNSGISMDLESDGGTNGYFRVRNNADQILFRVNHTGDGILDGDFTLESGGNVIAFEGADPVDIYTNTSNSSTALDIESQGSIDMVLDRDNDNPSMEFTIKRNGDGIAAVNKLFSVSEDISPLVYPHGTLTGQTGGIRFRELEASGSNYTGFRAPNNLSSDLFMTLPDNAGANSYLLQTNGLGILDWVDPSTLPGGGGPDTDWTIAGNDVYKATGTVSIGTSSFGSWPLNILNNTFSKTINVLHNYNGNLATDAVFIVSNNDAASGAATTRALYAKAEKAVTSGSTGEVQGAINWGINRYNGTTFSNAKGTESLGYKYGGTSGDAYGIFAEAYNENGGTSYGVFASTGVSSATEWALFCSGEAFATGVWQGSDRALKANIERHNSSLEKIMSLTVHLYDYRTNEYDFMHLPEGRHAGFMASDIEVWFPELVRETQHPGPSNASIEAGIYKPHAPVDFKSVNYIGLIPHLTRSIQEQQVMIEKKNDRIESLESTVSDLIRRIEQLEAQSGR